MARLRRLAPTTWLTAAVLVLLPLLAVLQYRWLSQVGADAGSRMQAVAANAARALSRDLAFEVNRAWLERAGGQAPPAAEATGSGAPLVVDALVISLDPSAQGEPALRRWNLDTRTCEPFAWPAGYDAIRAAVRDRDADQADGRVARGLLDSLRRDGAGLGAIPVAMEDEGPSRGSIRPPCVGLTHVIVLFRLDTATLRQTLLPELVRRHLEGLQGDFRFAIVAGPAQREVLYSSPASDAAAIAARPDVVVPITFGAGDRDRGQRGGGLPRRGGGPPRGASGPPDMGRDPQGHGGRGAAWLIVGQHRSGSLEAAVASLRSRNLAVSFGILLLMGVAVTIIAANARRAERLAGQQVDFVAAVSHEMRTPVSAIDLAAKNLEDGLIADPARVQRYGGVIRAEARRLGETVERVLQFAALDAGRADGTPVDIDLRSLVEDIVSLARREKPDASVEIEVEGRVDVVRADATVLRSCLQNLVGNALKYGGTPGWVRVRLARDDGPKPEVRVTVEDHGPGIEKRDLPHVFEPFYRGRLATERRVPGSGLGLHIVKRSVEMMGGRVSLRTEVGRGTAVTLHLSPGPDAARVPADSNEAAGSPSGDGA